MNTEPELSENGEIMAEIHYKRVLLKLSGEALAGEQRYGIDPETITTIANEIKEVVDLRS